MLLYEFKAGLNAYLAGWAPACRRTLADLIDFNEENREREMPYFGQELFVRAQKGPLTDREYASAATLAKRLSPAREGIDAALTQAPARCADRADRRPGVAHGPRQRRPLHRRLLSQSAAVAGYPHVTVPAGFVHGLPVGISFFGRRGASRR